MKRVLRCVNCGSVLQNKFPKKAGYINKDLDELNTDEVLYCETCYSALQINKEEEHKEIDENIIKILDDTKEKNGLIIYVSDFFSFSGHIRHQIVEKIEKLDIIFVANKMDLFKSIKSDSFKDFIKDKFQHYNIKLKDIILFSNYDNNGIEQLTKDIDKYGKNRDIYIIGPVYSGKRILTDTFLKSYKNQTKRPITSTIYKGTKLKVPTIPLTETTSIYCIPGFTNNDIISGKTDLATLRYVVPEGKINVSKIKLSKGELFFLGGLGGVELLNGKDCEFTLYFSKKVQTRKMKADKGYEFFHLNIATRKLLPVSDKFTSYKDFDVYDFIMDKDNKIHDIAIEGLGWVSFKAEGQTLRVSFPRGLSIKEGLGKVR